MSEKLACQIPWTVIGYSGIKITNLKPKNIQIYENTFYDENCREL